MSRIKVKYSITIAIVSSVFAVACSQKPELSQEQAGDKLWDTHLVLVRTGRDLQRGKPREAPSLLAAAAPADRARTRGRFDR